MKIDVMDFLESIDDTFEFLMNLELVSVFLLFYDSLSYEHVRHFLHIRDEVREIKKIQDGGEVYGC